MNICLLIEGGKITMVDAGLARLALAGEITDIGVVVVDCIGEKAGKPASWNYTIVPPDIKWVNERREVSI